MAEPSLHPYVEAILFYHQGKEIEINFGFVKTTLKTADSDINLKNVIVARVVEGRGDCLVVEKNGSKCFINGWQIQSVVSMSDPLYIRDFYQDEHEK